eukprot:621589-Amorphochlora_amoeboformis.AAC.1
MEDKMDTFYEMRMRQDAICNMQNAICDMRYAICGMQHAICDIQYAIIVLWRYEGPVFVVILMIA